MCTHAYEREPHTHTHIYIQSKGSRLLRINFANCQNKRASLVEHWLNKPGKTAISLIELNIISANARSAAAAAVHRERVDLSRWEIKMRI